MKLQVFNSSYFFGKSHFEDYLVFQPVYKYITKVANSNHISAWKSKGLSEESIKPSAASNNSFALALNYINTKPQVNFNGSCFKQDKVTYTDKAVVNIYNVDEINLWPFTIGKGFAVRNILFGAVKLTENADFDKYKYSGYSI